MPPTWLFVWSLERPPLLWQPQTPRMASKDCVVCEKKGTYTPPFFQGSSKKDPYMGLCLHKNTPTWEGAPLLQVPPPNSCTEVTNATSTPPFSWRNLRRKKQNEHLEHPLKAGQLFSDVFFPKRAVAGGIHILFFGVTEEFGFHKLCPTSAIFFPGFEKQSFVSLHRKQEIYNKQIKFHKLLWWPSIKHSGVQNWGSTLDTGITFEWPRKQLMKLAFLNLFWSSHTTRIGVLRAFGS